MNKTWIKVGFFSVICMFLVPRTEAQIWPGDVDNNGIVDQFDLLYLGHAIFEVGEPRLPFELGFDWEEKIAPNPWTQTFPSTGLDFSYADCDGDGIVTPDDYLAIDFNFGLTHGEVTEQVITPGVPGENPDLFFDTSMLPVGFPFNDGSVYFLPIHLGTPDIPVEEFSGIAFTIKYDPAIILPGFLSIDFGESWITPSGNESFEIIDPHSNLGEVKIGITKLFGDPIINGSGQIATMFFVIEDHVVSVNNPSLESIVEITDVKLVNDNFTSVPVVADTFVLLIEEEDFVASTELEKMEKIKITPNPANDFLNIIWEGSVGEKSIQLFNTLGQIVYTKETIGEQSTRLDISSVPSGIYVLELATKDGKRTEKILIE